MSDNGHIIDAATELLPREPDAGAAPPKRRQGGQPRNGNARTHGSNSAKRLLKELGERAIDGRTRLSKELVKWRAKMLADLGGKENLSTMELEVLDVVLRPRKVLLESVTGYLLEQKSLVIRRRKSIMPIVREWSALADAFVRDLQALGLERRTKQLPKDLRAYLTEAAAAKDSGSEMDR